MTKTEDVGLNMIFQRTTWQGTNWKDFGHSVMGRLGWGDPGQLLLWAEGAGEGFAFACCRPDPYSQD